MSNSRNTGQHTHANAFTLVELLIAISIIALAMGMMSTSMRRTDRDAIVSQAAESFAGTLKKARSMAISNNMPFAVAINIQNAPGSNGKVLNNRTGGHWYRILGPSSMQNTGHFEQSGPSGRRLLLPYLWDRTYTTANKFLPTFPQYTAALNRCWIGEKIALPEKKARFLALSDTEEGYRVNGEWADDTPVYVYSYPRPYFGYYDPVRKELFSWGGYDHDLGVANPWRCVNGQRTKTNYTGFFYEGKDGAITGCVNPTDRAYNVDWDKSNSFSGTDGFGRNELNYKVLEAGAPRALVNAEWGDFLICFTSEGDAFVPPFGLARKRFNDKQANPTAAQLIDRAGNGVMDMTRTWVDAGGFHDGYNAYSEAVFTMQKPNSRPVNTSEMGHFTEHTGGYHISIAADQPDDNTTFATAREALLSVLPVYRVFISKKGEITVRKVFEKDDSWLAAQNPWPSNQSSFTDLETLRTNLRFGWLHATHPTYQTTTFDKMPINDHGLDLWYGPEFCIPRGKPISYELTPAMLSKQQWWSDK